MKLGIWEGVLHPWGLAGIRLRYLPRRSAAYYYVPSTFCEGILLRKTDESTRLTILLSGGNRLCVSVILAFIV